MRRTTLSPFGTASRDLAPDPAPMHADLVARLGRNAGRFELGPEHVALALEATSWVPELDEHQARAVLLTVTCLLVAQSRGSTRMPLLGEQGRMWLGDTLAQLLARADEDGDDDGEATGTTANLTGTARAAATVLTGAATAPAGEATGAASGAAHGTPPGAAIGAATGAAHGSAPGTAHGDAAAPPPAPDATETTDDVEATVAAIQALFADPSSLGALIGPPEARRPLVLEGDWLYSQKLHAHEASFVQTLGERLRSTPAPAFSPDALEAALQGLRDRPSIVRDRRVVLSGEQELAVRQAASAPFTVVSGGPGTGKTSIVVSILRLLARLGVTPDQVALAAPTGKAAQRMAEAVSKSLHAIAAPAVEDTHLLAALPQGQTLHRLLGFSPRRGTFHAHAGNPLEHRVVIVDEASMIDMVLMERLVRAVGGHARLVLLGDADQLPSVGAGAVLRDLVPARADGLAGADVAPARADASPLEACAVRLTQSYRMDPSDPDGAAILTFARLINGDPVPPTPGSPPPPTTWRQALTVRADVPALTFTRVEALFPADLRPALDAFLERWHAERIEPLRATASRRYRYSTSTSSFDPDDLPHLERLFLGLEAQRLLCFTHGHRTGTRSVNTVLHRLVLRARGLEAHREHAFIPGDPLLVLHNDHDKGLWNGDQGVALWVATDGAPRPRLMAVFRRAASFVAFHLDLLRDQVERCHAMTVHKAQGSEFDHVIVLLPTRDGPLVTREVLYTAATRARKSVTLLGAEAVLAQAVARGTTRHTRLADCATCSPQVT